MSKLGWNAFVFKHKVGFGLQTRSFDFASRNLVTPDGRKWPTPAGALAKALRPILARDWAIDVEVKRSERSRLEIIRLICETQADLIRAGRLFDDDLYLLTQSNLRPFATLDNVSDLNGVMFLRLAHDQGFV